MRHTKTQAAYDTFPECYIGPMRNGGETRLSLQHNNTQGARDTCPECYIGPMRIVGKIDATGTGKSARHSSMGLAMVPIRLRLEVLPTCISRFTSSCVHGNINKTAWERGNM
jgi:hypothetical protein